MKAKKEVAYQIMVLMGHIEQICEDNQLEAPVEVEVTDVNGVLWQFEYEPSLAEIKVPLIPPEMPITVRIESCNGRCVERGFATLTADPEWAKFLYGEGGPVQ